MTEATAPGALAIAVTDDTLSAELSDGRTIAVPLDWFPRLVHATPDERDNWEIFGDGQSVHWPDLDEDISVEGLLVGQKSRENRRSFQQWLAAKREGRGLTLSELTAYEEQRQQGTDID